MRYTRINNTKHPQFQEVWSLYKKSFPSEERRQLRTQRKIMDNPLYHFEIINKEDVFIGFVMWWKFEDLIYIEHLATSPRFRGKGYGLHILERFISETKVPLLLEVEHPITEINKRRIGFYQRAGFVLNNHEYKQPPYKKNGMYVPLMLMTYPGAITKKEVRHFCEKYHPVIHHPLFL